MATASGHLRGTKRCIEMPVSPHTAVMRRYDRNSRGANGCADLRGRHLFARLRALVQATPKDADALDFAFVNFTKLGLR